MNALRTFILVAGVAAYPVVAAFSSLLGLPNSGLSVAVRGTIAASCLVVLVGSVNRGVHAFRNGMFLMLGAFWAAYVCRLFYSTMISGEVLSQPPFYYWMFAAGACLIPMLTIAMSRLEHNGITALKACLWLSFAAALATAVLGGTEVESFSGNIVDTGQFQLAALNAVSVGHLGVTLMLLGIAWYWLADERQGRLSRVLWLLASLLVGGYVLVISGSRGPLLALVLALSMPVAARYGVKGAIAVGAMLAGLVAVLWVWLASLDLTVLSRIQAGVSGDDASALTRVQSFIGGIQQFLESPLAGSGLEERTTGFYPHNIFIEALMATGAIFGSLMIIGLVALLLTCGRLAIRKHSYAWAGLLYVQYLVGALTSGALYASDQMWVLVGVLLAAGSGIGRAAVSPPQPQLSPQVPV